MESLTMQIDSKMFSRMTNLSQHSQFSHIYCRDYRGSKEYHDKLLNIARECAEIIAKSDIPAYDAEEVPYLLYEEIVRNNYHLAGQEKFKTFPPDSAILDKLENQ